MRPHSLISSAGSRQLALPATTPESERAPAAGSTLDELMTADQVAELLLMPVSTVKDYTRRGVLPSIKLGKHRRFVRSDVQAALDELAGGR